LDSYTGVRIRFQILLFLAVLTINEFFHNYILLFLTVGTLISVLKDDMSLRSHKKIVEIMVYLKLFAVLRIQSRIRMFLGLLDLDPLVGGPDPDPSIIKQKL
jgi:hypothetical protein